jgi:hypothetical protein
MAAVVERIAGIAKDPGLARWMREELADARFLLEIADDARVVVLALTEGAPPYPQILIVDLDELSPAELVELHAIRDRWFGAIIAIGVASPDLRTSLAIDFAVPPFRPGLLVKAVREIGLSRRTTRMEKLRP